MSPASGSFPRAFSYRRVLRPPSQFVEVSGGHPLNLAVLDYTAIWDESRAVAEAQGALQRNYPNASPSSA